jgi:sulfite oxidase
MQVFNPYGDVLLAWDMNGAPLPADHGAPLRAIVPGHVGVRNVKWVKELHASDVEAEGMWQRGMAYKMFPSSLKSLDGVDVESKVSMQEQPVQSAIIEPRAGSVVEGDSIDVKVRLP